MHGRSRMTTDPRISHPYKSFGTTRRGTGQSSWLMMDDGVPFGVFSYVTNDNIELRTTD